MNTTPFSVRLAQETKMKLEKLAGQQGRPISHLVQRAVDNYIDDIERFEREMAEAEAELDAGVFTSWEKVKNWMDTWDSDNEGPMPEADVFLKSTDAKQI